VQAAALFETPFQNFLVRAALLHTLNQIAMVHAQKIAAHAVGRFRRTEVFSIIFVKLAAQMQPNLVQHTREIHHAARHLFGTLWIGSHTQMNRIIGGGAILASLLSENHSEKAQVIQTRLTNQKLPSSTTAAEHAGAHRAINIGFSRSFHMIGSAKAVTMI